MNNLYSGLMVAVIAIVTLLLRALPYAIIGMLVVYCLRGVKVWSAPYGLPELFGTGTVVFLHLWKRNTLLSIALGTVVYMVSVQFVFSI